ncbi:MAG: hypothetical protein AAF927_22635 [Bacteroidota bacterium]
MNFRPFLPLVVFNMLAVSLMAQQPRFSYHGNVHTPKGDLHTLVVFIRYDEVSLMKDDAIWPDKSEEGVLPKIAMGAQNQLFYDNPADIVGGDKQNISDYFYAMSGGAFRITADIFPIQVPVKFIRETRGNFFKRQSEMNTAAIRWIEENYPDFDWSRYDNRTNHPDYRYDNSNSAPDSIIDYIVFMHRANGSTGMGASSSINLRNGYKIRNGHTGIKSYRDRKHNLEYFKHEFAHNLYDCPHYLGANSADGNRYYTQKGWGLMAAWHSPFFTANAWEAWWLGWIKPQEVRQNGVYQLNDYLVGRDAIRIPIPGSRHTLWIENHQKLNHWDDKLFFKDPNQGHPQSAPGIYMYVVAEPGADRKSPQLKPFDRRQANFIRMLNGQGNADYRFTGDSISTGYFMGPVMETMQQNPFAGQNAFQFIRADYNKDGRILVGMSHGNSDSGGREQMDIWNECIHGENICTLAGTGSEKDALGVGDEVGLSGIFPVTNFPAYTRAGQVMEASIITGISVRIISQEASGSYQLEINFDDFNVRKDQRWCGPLILPASDNPQRSDTYLKIAKGTTLSLDLSGTPNREAPHPETETFATPTAMTVSANRGIRLESGSELIIENFSHLSLIGNAQLIVSKGAKLTIRKQGLLILNDISQLIVERGGRLTIESDGDLRQMRDANVEIARWARVRDRR